MGVLENTSNRRYIILYRRLIDDLFLIWKGNEKKARRFVNKLNTNDWGVKFTPKCDDHKIDFLNLIVPQHILKPWILIVI